MLDLLSKIPLPVILGVVAVAAFLLWKYAGARAALVAVALGLLAIVNRLGRNAGVKEEKDRDARQDLKDFKKTVEKSNAAAEDADRRREPGLHDAGGIVSGDELPDWSKRR